VDHILERGDEDRRIEQAQLNGPCRQLGEADEPVLTHRDLQQHIRERAPIWLTRALTTLWIHLVS